MNCSASHKYVDADYKEAFTCLFCETENSIATPSCLKTNLSLDLIYFHNIQIIEITFKCIDFKIKVLCLKGNSRQLRFACCNYFREAC
ncbi:hypothetical protein Sjap_025873 [Stephania japonica]|uniref:Uncharacterized protein n=1 Tax=Stephania japonica TaxID=461633 RepID=A0AAP0E5Z1_9MAGN